MRLGVVREQQQAGPRVLRPNTLRRAQPAFGAGWHPDIEDRDVGLLPRQHLKQRVAVGDASDHLVPGRGEQQEQALAEQGTVLGEGYPHGFHTTIP
jgi:hypothetical protein